MHRQLTDTEQSQPKPDGRIPWKRVVIVAAAVIVGLQWIRIAAKPRGDFLLHWELGRRLAAGEFIYERGLDHPYPPFWGLAHAPLSVVSMPVAQTLLFPLFLISAAGLLWALRRLSQDHLPLSRDATFWVAAAALALGSRFLVRDMLECGVNLMLVALSWCAVYLWTRHRDWLAGITLGLAMALKCTPTLFLAYFVWKRQWKVAAATTAAAATFTLSPMLWMGPVEYARAGQFWFERAWRGVGEEDPSQGVLGPEPLQNVSLRPSLARFLMHLPEGHAGRIEHPFYVDFANLSPRTAGFVIKAVLLLLLAGLAWKSRKPVTDRRDPAVLWECAAASLLILLYSPITWGQHCVGVVPAFYLLTRRWAVGHSMPAGTRAVLAVYVILVLGMNRSLIGKQWSWLLDSYHVQTWCIVGLLALTAACHQSQPAHAVQSGTPEDDAKPRRAA